MLRESEEDTRTDSRMYVRTAGDSFQSHLPKSLVTWVEQGGYRLLGTMKRLHWQGGMFHQSLTKSFCQKKCTYHSSSVFCMRIHHCLVVRKRTTSEVLERRSNNSPRLAARSDERSRMGTKLFRRPWVMGRNSMRFQRSRKLRPKTASLLSAELSCAWSSLVHVRLWRSNTHRKRQHTFT